jgi:hypothetical protein
MKLEFSRQIFDEYANTKFHEDLPVGAELFMRADGQTYRHEAFRDVANAPASS